MKLLYSFYTVLRNTNSITETTHCVLSEKAETSQPIRNSLRFGAARLLISLILLMVMQGVVLGQTVGPRNAGTGANVTGIGSQAWANPGNIGISGNATADLSAGETSNYLKGTGYGFSIPSYATILGIQVIISRSASQTLGVGCRDQAVHLVKANAIQTALNKATSSTWPTSLGTASYGSASDLWSNTWTPSDINDPNFGVAFSAHNNGSLTSRTANVDYMQITVTYVINCIDPTTYTVTGTGLYCIGDAGKNVYLSNSETGVNYQLKLNGNNSGAAVAGTGAAIDFGIQTAGTYTVRATRVNGGCSSDMTGSAIITQNSQVVATVSNHKDISCFAGSDGEITVSASGGVSPYTFSVDNGINYLPATGTDVRVFSGLQANTPYRIIVKDSNGCTSPAIP